MPTFWKYLFVMFLYCMSGLGTGQAALAAHTDILVVGDSLSAEYGLAQGTGWVNLTQQRLLKQKESYTIHNASISGDTTSGGLNRLPDALKQWQPAIVIIELGSNDALRGLSLDMTQNNLAQMIMLSEQAGAQVILVGMQIPPNYGRRYTEQFAQMFSELASEHGTAFVPFLMAGMALDKALFQNDGIHPNEKAQPILADNVWAALEPLLEQN